MKDKEPNQTGKKKGLRIGRLRDPEDVSRFLAKCVKETVRDRGDTHWYRAGTLCSILLKSLELSSVDKRLRDLERKVNLK